MVEVGWVRAVWNGQDWQTPVGRVLASRPKWQFQGPLLIHPVVRPGCLLDRSLETEASISPCL